MTTIQLKNLEATVKTACEGHNWQTDLATAQDIGDPDAEERIEIHTNRLSINIYQNARDTVYIELVSPMLEDKDVNENACRAFTKKGYYACGQNEEWDLGLWDLSLHYIPRDAAYIENTIRDINVLFEKLANIMDSYTSELKQVSI